MSDAGDDDVVVAAARAGDESAFAALVERHRGELRLTLDHTAFAALLRTIRTGAHDR